MAPWYALHVASNMERQVSERLDRADIESYYPHSYLKSRDGRRNVQHKLIPGYVFARFEFSDRTPVIQIPQVIRILGIGREPVEIPAIEIETVKLMSEQGANVLAHPFFAAGESVYIRRGPLQGLEGFVVASKPGKARVVVSVMMVQRSISAEVDSADVESILPRAA